MPCGPANLSAYNAESRYRAIRLLTELCHKNEAHETVSTILTPCRVPWAISPSMSGVTLTHSESDVEPECTVVFGGGRLNADHRIDSRRIEITFKMCYHARLGPHADLETIEAIGYLINPAYDGDINDYSERCHRTWFATGNCPDSGFYYAKESAWLATLPTFFQRDFRHYVVDGRDGYVELIAQQFAWREWLWSSGHRDDAPSAGPVVGTGEGVA